MQIYLCTYLAAHPGGQVQTGSRLLLARSDEEALGHTHANAKRETSALVNDDRWTVKTDISRIPMDDLQRLIGLAKRNGLRAV